MKVPPLLLTSGYSELLYWYDQFSFKSMSALRGISIVETVNGDIIRKILGTLKSNWTLNVFQVIKSF